MSASTEQEDSNVNVTWYLESQMYMIVIRIMVQ